jgi:hypothetical protein
MENKTKLFFSLILLLNFIFISFFFPINKVINKEQISSVDYPIHYFRYSEFTNTPINLISSFITINDLKLISIILFFLPKLLIFKTYIFLFLLAIPLIFYKGSEICFKDKNSALISMLLSSIIFFYSFFIKQRLQSGLFPFLFSTSLVFLSCCYFYRDGIKTKKAWFFLFWSLLIHPFAIIYFLIFSSIKFWKNKLISISSIILIFLLGIVQYIWFGLDSYFHQSTGFKGILDIISYPLFLFTFIFSIYSLIKFKKRTFWIVLITSTFLFAHFIGLLNIFSALQPQRAMYFLFFFLIILAPLKIKKTKEIILALVILLTLILINQNLLFASIDHKLEFGIHPDLIEIKNSIKTPSNIWIECSTYQTDLVYGGHSDYLFKSWFPQEKVILSYISNNPFKLSKHFCEGKVNGKPISNEIIEIIETNNISHIIIWTNESKNFFSEKTCFSKFCLVEKFK